MNFFFHHVQEPIHYSDLEYNVNIISWPFIHSLPWNSSARLNGSLNQLTNSPPPQICFKWISPDHTRVLQKSRVTRKWPTPSLWHKLNENSYNFLHFVSILETLFTFLPEDVILLDIPCFWIRKTGHKESYNHQNKTQNMQLNMKNLTNFTWSAGFIWGPEHRDFFFISYYQDNLTSFWKLRLPALGCKTSNDH